MPGPDRSQVADRDTAPDQPALTRPESPEAHAGRGRRVPLGLTLAVVAVTGLYAWNQRYVFDWDACFRAFTGFAGRDLFLGCLDGQVRSLAAAKTILCHYADFFEARPGSVVSYPPGQTLILGVLGLLSTQQLVLALFNVSLFGLLSLGVWRLAERLRLSPASRLLAWAVVCLHPTIVLTVWSMRRGLFEAAVVCWCLVWLTDFQRRPRLRTFLWVVCAVVGGFLYRETLALVAVPAAVLFLARSRRIEWDLRGNAIILAVALALIAAATVFALAQVRLASRGQLSLFTKTYTYVREIGGGPPRRALTMHGYYQGQFGPEAYLGLDEAQLRAVGAPEQYRLARGRWGLPVPFKVVYVTSSVVANPLVVLLLGLGLAGLLWRRPVTVSGGVLLAGSLSALYWVFLWPLGGIPDYITPVLPGTAILCGAAVDGIPAGAWPWRRLLSAATTAVAVTVATVYLYGFAVGALEEYPPRYDYDRITAALLEMAPERQFGVTVDLHLVKNLAYSKLRLDPRNRMACYSLSGARLPTERLFDRETYERYSPILRLRRDVPGVRYFIFRSQAEQELTETRLATLGFRPPYWDAAGSVTVQGRKPLLGEFRPVYIRRLRPGTRPDSDPHPQTGDP